ncbi:MAG: sulfur carrier protein ThiS [Chloroflexi bacterium]|nr:sulfur carrier protein ThiS [Chloroflexota bacterium]
MIQLVINGKEEKLEGPTRLMDYLEQMKVNTRYIAVAYNGAVLRRGELTGVTLSEGDNVEIVRAVGGG